MRKVDPAKYEEKRREILEAAGRCFARDGFKGATVSTICAEAKVSPGHLYHYFESKESIIEAMTQAGLEYAATRFGHIMQGANIVTALVAEIDTAKAHYERAGQPLLFDMLTEATRSPAVGAILRDHSRAIWALLADVLRKGQAKGQVDPSLDPALTAAVLLSIIDGSKTLAIRDAKIDLNETRKLLKILIARFLTPPPGADPA
jgi:TetR/AcrR family transcriptional regulator, repressor for uid operon